MRALTAILLSLAAAVSVAQQEDAGSRLSSLLERTASYRADFTQRVTDADGQIVEQGSGRFWLARPERFRWEYLEPWPRVLVSDGALIWLYDEELEQATVRDAAGLIEQTPAGILAGKTALLDEFEVAEEVTGDLSRMVLVPRAGGDFSRIEMVFEAGTLSALQLDDQFGQRTRIDFSAIAVNEPPDAELFDFAVPDGVDLIDERTSPDAG